jgi:hypothetical protein
MNLAVRAKGQGEGRVSTNEKKEEGEEVGEYTLVSA